MAQYSGIFTTTQQMQAVAATTWTAGPGAPTSVTASAGNQSASVSFTAPTNTGNPPGISSYIVTSSPGGITASGSSSPITVSGLTNGTAYTFTVQAIGTYSGPGAISAASNSVTPSENYIEDVFSTYLYTGNASTRDILNGIDLSTKGGMVWIKDRGFTDRHIIQDTVRGINSQLSSNNTDAATTSGNQIKGFYTNGFQLGYDDPVNRDTYPFVSWTFRKQAKFFDVVTYTGNGGSGALKVNHSLGVTPAFVIIKNTSNTSNWAVCARNSSGNYEQLYLNTTAASLGTIASSSNVFTSTQLDIYTLYATSSFATSSFNSSGDTYVAYLFAHDAGGFGTAGTDNVISCGSFTTNSAGEATVNLGYEPQYVLWKIIDTTGSWGIKDSMRGIYVDPAPNESPVLFANTSSAESQSASIQLTSTGFRTNLSAQVRTYIYIAIRRGPMKTPTDGTKVFAPVAYSGNSGTNLVSGNVLMDWAFVSPRNNSQGRTGYTRLTGNDRMLILNSSSAEDVFGTGRQEFDEMSGIQWTTNYDYCNASGWTYVMETFKRAPGFFDVVCYTGTGSARTVTHNLGVAPEFMIVKARSAENWFTYMSNLGATKRGPCIDLGDGGNTGSSYWNNTEPTSSVFTVGTDGGTNASATNYVAYLFASCPGVSKVGSYTGTGTTQQINCGFTGGARFVLIKLLGNGSGWYVWDSARGIVSGNDPYFLINSTAAEVTNTDYVDTYASGFEISSTAPAEINASGSTYFYLAIA